MAIFILGTVVKLPSKDVPDGFVQPAVSTFADLDYLGDRVINVVKSTVEDAVELTTFNNIITDIEAQILAEITADYIATNTVDVYIVWKQVGSNVDCNNKVGSSFYTNEAVNYDCTCQIYVRTT